jgi:hypothetical protein
MARKAVSVTLDTDNVIWLKGRAGAAGKSVSEILDRIVAGARQRGLVGPSRSVAGTIDIDSSDPLLDRADASLRAAFELSLARPLIVAERRAPARVKRGRARKRRA